MRIHITHFSDCGCLSEKKDAEIATLRAEAELLVRQRDAYREVAVEFANEYRSADSTEWVDGEAKNILERKDAPVR